MLKTLLFRLGLIPLVFLIWAWSDSTRPQITWAAGEVAGYSLHFYHSLSRIYVEFSSGASPGFPNEFSFFREWHAPDYPVKSPFSVAGGLFPEPTFVPEVPDNSDHILTEEESSRIETGERSGSLTIPYWGIVTLYLVLWLGISCSYAKKRSKLQKAPFLPS